MLPPRVFLTHAVRGPERAVARLLDRITENPIRWSLGIFVSGYVVGGGAFSLIEKNASFFDGLWWAYISMFTVGYGDFSPHTWIIRILAYPVVLSGWCSLLILGGALAGRIAEKRINVKHVLETPELSDDFEFLIERTDDYHELVRTHCERLRAVTSHPRVVEALREIHEQEATS